MIDLIKLTDDQKALSLNSIGYSEKSLEEDLERFKLWINTQAHLPRQANEESDTFLKTFLVGCKGRLDIAKKKFDKYYTLRSKISYLLLERDPLNDHLIKTLTNGCFGILPKPTSDGSRIIFGGIRNPDPEAFDAGASAKGSLLLFEIMSRTEAVHNGYYVIVDFKEFTLKHFARIPPAYIMDYLEYLQELPIRIRGVFFINVPSSTESIVYPILKRFISTKLLQRVFIQFYADEKKLLQHFPKDIIPVDFGGNERTLKKLGDTFFEACKSRREWILNHLSGICDENKRTNKLNTNSIEGTFRQLAID